MSNAEQKWYNTELSKSNSNGCLFLSFFLTFDMQPSVLMIMLHIMTLIIKLYVTGNSKPGLYDFVTIFQIFESILQQKILPEVQTRWLVKLV